MLGLGVEGRLVVRPGKKRAYGLASGRQRRAERNAKSGRPFEWYSAILRNEMGFVESTWLWL